MCVAKIAETASLLNDLALASVHDRDASGVLHQQRWNDPRRYDLVETLLNKPQIPDSTASHVLDRLGESELDDIAASAATGSMLDHLCSSAIERRSPRAVPASRVTARRPAEKLPSDEDLSKVDDPQAVLLDLVKSRGMDQDRKIQHALGFVYMTMTSPCAFQSDQLRAIRFTVPGSPPDCRDLRRLTGPLAAARQP